MVCRVGGRCCLSCCAYGSWCYDTKQARAWRAAAAIVFALLCKNFSVDLSITFAGVATHNSLVCLSLSHIFSHAGYRSLTPGSLMSRKGHEYLSQMSPGQEDGHSFPPPLLTPASYKALAAPAPSVLGAAIPGASGTGNTPAGGTVEDDPYTVRAAALLALPPTGEHRYVWQSGRRT
jgi:hypothetical protein